MLTKNGGGDHKRRLSRVHYICTMHCVQCTLEKQSTAHHVLSNFNFIRYLTYPCWVLNYSLSVIVAWFEECLPLSTLRHDDKKYDVAETKVAKIPHTSPDGLSMRHLWRVFKRHMTARYREWTALCPIVGVLSCPKSIRFNISLGHRDLFCPKSHLMYRMLGVMLPHKNSANFILQ